MKNMNENVLPCTDCQAGQMHRRFITYFTWLGDELITVPNFPAWICDVCGKREYDARAVTRLTLLLNPNAGKSTHPHPSPHRPAPKSSPPPVK